MLSVQFTSVQFIAVAVYTRLVASTGETEFEIKPILKWHIMDGNKHRYVKACLAVGVIIYREKGKHNN